MTQETDCDRMTLQCDRLVSRLSAEWSYRVELSLSPRVSDWHQPGRHGLGHPSRPGHPYTCRLLRPGLVAPAPVHGPCAGGCPSYHTCHTERSPQAHAESDSVCKMSHVASHSVRIFSAKEHLRCFILWDGGTVLPGRKYDPDLNGSLMWLKTS